MAFSFLMQRDKYWYQFDGHAFFGFTVESFVHLSEWAMPELLLKDVPICDYDLVVSFAEGKEILFAVNFTKIECKHL